LEKAASLKLILGVDISKGWFDVVLTSFDGSVAEVHEQFTNDKKGFEKLIKWITRVLKGEESYSITTCMEATGSYWKKLAKFLFDNAITVYVVNPARIKAYHKSEQQRSKTDKIDAGVIGRFFKAQWEKLQLWVPPRYELVELQSYVRTRTALVEARSRFTCMTKSQIRLNSQKYLNDQIDFLTANIKELEDSIEKLIERDVEFRTLSECGRSLGKGIGPVTISTLIAEYREFVEFHDAKQAVAYAGLDVSLYDSGSSVRGKPRISKQGNSQVRRILYLAAEQAAHRNPALMPLYKRLVAKGLTKKAAIVACARKILELLFMLMKGKKKFDLEVYQKALAA
jgi:transposase